MGASSTGGLTYSAANRLDGLGYAIGDIVSSTITSSVGVTSYYPDYSGRLQVRRIGARKQLNSRGFSKRLKNSALYEKPFTGV